jgi:ATP-binding cassette subfamily C protein
MPATNRILFTINHIQSQNRNVEMVVSDFKNLEASRKVEVADTEITFERTIKLTDVTFIYPGKSRPTLDKINAEILCGERIGIVGPSGAGKTSLVNLVMGLINPEQGGVSVDGVPISERLSAWRQRIGFVPQTIRLFDDTLRRNVAIGKKDEEIDDARVSEALKQAQLDAVVGALPDRLETIVGEHGAKMSGGQIQRIGIARALYNDPDVLVLDEATAALDLATERDLNSALESLGGKTQIVIAHRLSTVRNCDRLFYMEDGRITAIGDFETLYRQNDAFRYLVDLLEADNRVAPE